MARGAFLCRWKCSSGENVYGKIRINTEIHGLPVKSEALNEIGKRCLTEQNWKGEHDEKVDLDFAVNVDPDFLRVCVFLQWHIKYRTDGDSAIQP
jgi:hypothetical protein